MENYFFDMETSDPDDVFTLCFLATHPKSNLVGVTVHPGDEEQVNLVKYILNKLGKYHIPVGGNDKKTKGRVSKFHYNWLGNIYESAMLKMDNLAVNVIKDALTRNENVHLITGAALTNVHNYALTNPTTFFKKWTCQGGFVGSNIVPKDLQLQKFADMEICPTFNLNGNVNAALFLLSTENKLFNSIRMVSKNVCHGVIWDKQLNDSIKDNVHEGLLLVKNGMEVYFNKNPQGKALHDILAATAAIDESVFIWKNVTPYRFKGGWGCLPSESDYIKATINIDMFNFITALDS